MVPIDTIFNDTLQILRDPAWTGVGVIVSATLSLYAIVHTNRSVTPRGNSPILKKF